MHNNQKNVIQQNVFLYFHKMSLTGIKFYQLRSLKDIFCIKIIFYYFSMIKNKIMNYRPGIYLRKLNFHTKY